MFYVTTSNSVDRRLNEGCIKFLSVMRVINKSVNKLHKTLLKHI